MILQYMYPSGSHLCSFSRATGYGTQDRTGWSNVPGGDCTTYCDDLVGALDEEGYATAASNSTQMIYDTGQFEWHATAPPQGCTISKVQIWAYCRKSTGNAQIMDGDPTLMAFVRQNTSSTRNYSATTVTVTGATYRNRVFPYGTFTKYDFGSFDVCPWTSSSWTQADLAAGAFTFGLASDGTHGSGIPPTDGGAQVNLDVASVYLELTTTPLDTAEPVRSVISTLLRLFRKPLRLFSIKLPPQFGQVSPGDTVYSTHPLLPFPGGTAGLEVWRQVPLFVLQIRDEFEPPGVQIDCIDLRQVYVNWWSPFRTTIGVTDDYRGIARLDRGGGWETDRNSSAYVQRPGDYAAQEVAQDRAPVGKDGLLIEGGADVSLLLNNTFSLGTSVFTYWTQSITGSASIVSDTDYYFLDASGYRRSAKFTVASGASAYLYQATSSIAGNTVVHVHAWARVDSGTDQVAVIITRAVDGNYWDDHSGLWQAGASTAYIDRSVLWTKWISKAINVGGSSTTVTVRIGIAGTNGANVAHVGAVQLVTGTRSFASRRSLLPTQHSSATRTKNVTWLNNDVTYRVWYADKGWIKFTFTPNWSHSDLNDNDSKYLIYAEHNSTAGNNSRIWYTRTGELAGSWYFDINSSGGTIISSYRPGADQLPAAGTPIRIAARWTSVADDEFDLGGQACQLFVDSQDPSTAAPSTLLTELRSYWRLNEASGTRFDAHGTMDLSEVAGPLGTVAGVFGNAVYIQGSSGQYLKHSFDTSLNVGTTGGGATYNCWIKTTDGGNYPGLMTFDAGVGDVYRPFELAMGGGKVAARIQLQNGDVIGPTDYAGMNDNAWHMMTAVFRPADSKVYLYEAAVQRSATTSGANAIVKTVGPEAYAIEDWKIGNFYYGVYNGAMMAAGVWNRDLTTDEITTLYNAGSGIDYPFGVTTSQWNNGTEPGILDQAKIYVGSYPGSSDGEFADGIFTRFEIGSHPLTATELKDRTGTVVTHTIYGGQEQLTVAGVATVQAIPLTRTGTVATHDLVAAGTAAKQRIPATYSPTVSAAGVKAAGVATTTFVSA